MKLWIWPPDNELMITGYIFGYQFWHFKISIFMDEMNPEHRGWIYIGEFD